MKSDIVGHKTGLISKVIIYVLLIFLLVTIVVPVAWVFMASIKENSEFYGNPFALPQGVHWQNFVDAWTKARMGDYFFTSVMVTAMALVILLIVALPAAYVLSRYKFVGSKFINTCFMAGLFINVSYIVVPIFLMFVSGDRIVRSIFGTTFFLNNPFVVSWCWRPPRCRSPFTCSAAIWPRFRRTMRRPPTWTARAISPPWCASSCPWPSPASSR